MFRKVINFVLVIVVLSVVLQIPILNSNNEVNQSNVAKIILIINDFCVALLNITVEILKELGEILKAKFV